MKANNADHSSVKSDVKVKLANAQASSSGTGVVEYSIVPSTCGLLETTCVIALVTQRYCPTNLCLEMGTVLHRNA